MICLVRQHIEDDPNPLSESAVIRLARRVKHSGASRVIKGIGDDCAVIRQPGGGVLLITTDVFIEGIHFLTQQSPESVGAKLLAVNLSDIAAMGGRPGEAVVNLMLPKETSLEWVERFFAGMSKIAERFEVNLVGGDTSRHPERITLSLTLTGRCRKDEVVYRSGAKVGDLIFVSGTLGDADAGMGEMKSGEWRVESRGEGHVHNEATLPLIERYLSPEPRVELGRLLARTHCASAMIDLSDGLAVGLRQLAEASHHSEVIDFNMIPISKSLEQYCERLKITPRDWAIKAGGDYELLFTVPQKDARRVERFGLKRPELPILTKIGRIVDGGGEVFVQRGGETGRLEGGGWEHFADRIESSASG